MKPMAVQITPGWNAFHSGSRHIHIPSANSRPPMVPMIRFTNADFFIFYILLEIFS
jgi:hypothetical protein